MKESDAGNLQWHSAFRAIFQIELEDEADKLQIEAGSYKYSDTCKLG